MSMKLNDLCEVLFPVALAAGQVLTFNGTAWVNAAAGSALTGGATPADGQAPVYDAGTGTFVSRTVAVIQGTPTAGQSLVWDPAAAGGAGAFVPATPTAGGGVAELSGPLAGNIQTNGHYINGGLGDAGIFVDPLGQVSIVGLGTEPFPDSPVFGATHSCRLYVPASDGITGAYFDLTAPGGQTAAVAGIALTGANSNGGFFAINTSPSALSYDPASKVHLAYAYLGTTYAIYVESGPCHFGGDATLVGTGSGTWADHVLEPGYELMSLDQLRSYTAVNHRLPGVPSAAEVAESGIKMSEMFKVFLEKIEENALHLMGLNERLANLERELL